MPATCPICQGPVLQSATGRPRLYCSRACQAKAYRARATEAPAPARAQAPGAPGTPLRTHTDAVLLAASVLERALTDPGAAARLAGAARDLAAWADSLTAPVAPAPAAPRLPARDETRQETRRRRAPRRTADETARDETVPAAPEQPSGIEARPQKLPRKRAMAIIDTAELVRAPGTDRHASQWVLRSGETVLGRVEPSYGGASRSGRNGWQALLPGEHTSRRPHPTRNTAAAELARKWVELVTSTPRRTITGG